jgi:hypothetical protein
LFDDDLALGTISDDGLTPMTELRFFGRGNIALAQLDGVPISFQNLGGVGSIWIPTGGELRVEFTAVPEASTLTLLTAAVTFAAMCRRRRSLSTPSKGANLR